MKEYYSKLFLKDGASIEKVKKAHRKLVKKFHPDNNQGDNEFTEEFKQIQDAYEKLIEYLREGKTSNYSENFTRHNSNYSTEESIVKSDAMFAEAGEIIEDDKFYKAIITTLIGVFIFCGIYALLSLSHIL